MIPQHPVGPQSFTFGTRGSALALAQTRLVVARFRDAFPDHALDLRIIKTEGDLDKTSPLSSIGGRGVFTSAIEAAVRAGAVDAAVHSAKDLPTALSADAPIVAIPIRDDPRDALVSRHGVTLDRLPPSPVIGTSSRRRSVQILRMRPDARIAPLRGNIDTRLRKAEGPGFDAIVVAAAGLRRMGWHERISQVFSVDEMVPSPAQGALAVQGKTGSLAATLLASIDEPTASIPVAIERAFLAALGAGCTCPAGAFAEAIDGSYRLVAMLANADGDRLGIADDLLASGDEGLQAAEIAARLREQVGMVADCRSWTGLSDHDCTLRGARVVVTRPRAQAAPLIDALTERGAEPLSLPTIRVEPIPETPEIDEACERASRGEYGWIAFTSANAVEAIEARLKALGIRPEELAIVNVAAVGGATAAAAQGAGFRVKLVPATATSETLAAELIALLPPGVRVFYPCSEIGRDVLPHALQGAGIDVTTLPVYRTVQETEVDPQVLAQVRRGEIDAIVFSSPSSVRNLFALLGDVPPGFHRIPVISAGPATAEAARGAGFQSVAISAGPGVAALLTAIGDVWRNRSRSDAPLAVSSQQPATVTMSERSVR